MNRVTGAKLETARVLGYDAAARGLTPRAPALDPQWCALLVGWEIGEGAAEMASAWLNGYQDYCDELVDRILQED